MEGDLGLGSMILVIIPRAVEVVVVGVVAADMGSVGPVDSVSRIREMLGSERGTFGSPQPGWLPVVAST